MAAETDGLAGSGAPDPTPSSVSERDRSSVRPGRLRHPDLLVDQRVDAIRDHREVHDDEATLAVTPRADI